MDSFIVHRSDSVALCHDLANEDGSLKKHDTLTQQRSNALDFRHRFEIDDAGTTLKNIHRIAIHNVHDVVGRVFTVADSDEGSIVDLQLVNNIF